MVINRNRIKDWIKESISVKEKIRSDPQLRRQIEVAASLLIGTLSFGGTVFACGNGGSASDSAHFVGELLNRFTLKREYPLAAVDLSAPNATITAIANDYSFDQIFSKQLEALGCEKDTLLAISTSGKSANIIKAMYMADQRGMHTILLTGQDVNFNTTILSGDGSLLRRAFNIQHINVPSKDTPIIQESHIMIIHILCQLIDEYFEVNRLWR